MGQQSLACGPRGIETGGRGVRCCHEKACAVLATSRYFDQAFESPFYQLRLTHYPPVQEGSHDHVGIHPHVDTTCTLFTILKRTHAGLIIREERSGEWKRVPLVKDAFIVNVGELL
jgi:isopenicillin N synthase-like dioxygenase